MRSPELPVRIEHLASEHRFIARLAEGDAVLAYDMISTGLMDIQSTYVPPAARGRGVGGALVEAAVAFARDRGLQIRPTCWYAGVWLSRHPELSGMVRE